MFSSSSSDIDNENCFYGRHSNGTPWSMQPLVYYTHVPNRGKQRSRESRKRNPNCFVKAFRWYTQERYPCKKTDSMSTNAPDVKGFAMWLDEKYHEFLQENKNERRNYSYAMKRTSTMEIETIYNNFPCDSCGAKKFKRLKSPRKRHKKLTNSKDKGNTILRSNKSFEILLYPKHVSRTASECCQRGYSCCTECLSLEDKNARRKSQSLTSVLIEKEVCVIPYDVIHIDDVKDNKLTSGIRESEAKKIIATIVEPPNQNDEPIAISTAENNYEKSQIKNGSCQCILNKSNTNMFTQCDSNKSDVKKVLTKEIDCIKNKYTLQASFPMSQRNGNEKNLTSTPFTSTDNGCKCISQQNADVKENESSTNFTNGTQTSDYPINLPTEQHYPLFMRIICPDKLNES